MENLDEIRDLAILAGTLNNEINEKNSTLYGYDAQKQAINRIDPRKFLPANMTMPNMVPPRPPSIELPQDMSGVAPSAPLIPLHEMFPDGKIPDGFKMPPSLMQRVAPNAQDQQQRPQQLQPQQFLQFQPPQPPAIPAQPDPQLEFGFLNKVSHSINNPIEDIQQQLKNMSDRMKIMESKLNELLLRTKKRSYTKKDENE